MKNILVIKDDYDSYLSLVGCVIQKREIDFILQLEAQNPGNHDLVSELNDWLQSKAYPQIVSGCNLNSVLETIEGARRRPFDSFPNDINSVVESTSGLLVSCDHDSISFGSCLTDWAWDDDGVSEAVILLADLPDEIQRILEELKEREDEADQPIPYGSEELQYSEIA